MRQEIWSLLFHLGMLDRDVDSVGGFAHSLAVDLAEMQRFWVCSGLADLTENT